LTPTQNSPSRCSNRDKRRSTDVIEPELKQTHRPCARISSSRRASAILTSLEEIRSAAAPLGRVAGTGAGGSV
jgi:hypothetical protein